MVQVGADLDDAALVRAVQAGDPGAFDMLFRRHYAAVRRVCARRTAGPHEADEVTQAAFVRALERIDRCHGERRFGAWVQVIALRLCADAGRARARTTPMEDPLGPDRSPGRDECWDAVECRQRAEGVHRALAGLPDRQRAVIVARDLHGRRPPEIAAALAVSVGTVDSLLLRARRRMVAACRATGLDQAGAATPLGTASAAVAAAAGRPLARAAGAVSAAVAGAASSVVGALGGGGPAPALGRRAAELVAMGALAAAPFGPPATVGDPRPALPPLTVGLPAPPPAPGLLAPLPPAPAPAVPAEVPPAAPALPAAPPAPAPPAPAAAPAPAAPPVPAGAAGALLGAVGGLLGGR